MDIVGNLCKLLKTLGENERAALEILVAEWVTSEALDKSSIQVMLSMYLNHYNVKLPFLFGQAFHLGFMFVGHVGAIHSSPQGYNSRRK